MKRLKTAEIKDTRELLLQQQSYRCAICNLDCSADPVLDHDHKTGLIRAALHRQCNAYLGRIENNAARHGVQDLAEFLRNAASYVERHSSDQTGLLHPTYRTAEEKATRAKKRAKQRRAKKRALIAGTDDK